MTQDGEVYPSSQIQPPTIRASLLIRDFDGPPGLISEILGIQPTRAGQAGEPSLNVLGKARGTTLRFSYWSLHSGAGYRAPLSEHVADLMRQVRGARHAFARLPSGSTVTLRVTVIPPGPLPPFKVEADAVNELSEIGAAFQLDIVSIEEPPAGHGADAADQSTPA